MEYVNKKIDLADLIGSKVNVRGMGRKSGVANLAADIQHQGLIQPLTVFKDGASYCVDAGQRRLAAIQILAERGDWSGPVPCRVIPSATSTEDRSAISFAENAGQLPMHALDRMRVLVKFTRQGMSAEQIAARFGLSEKEVQRVLRLDRLALPIRAALAAGKLSEAKGLAYAETIDRTAQMKAFDRAQTWTSAKDIRASLRNLTGQVSQTMSETDDLFEAVAKEYFAAGGKVTGDLFTLEGEGKVDGALVRSLAEQKLKAAAEAAKQEFGAAWSEISLSHKRPRNTHKWPASEGPAPCPTGVFVGFGWNGEVSVFSSLIRDADFEAWEAAQRGIAPDEFGEISSGGTQEDAGAEDEPASTVRKPSRPMDRATEAALTTALQERLAQSFPAAMDTFLFCALGDVFDTHKNPLEMRLARGELDVPEWLDAMQSAHKGDRWGLIDAMSETQKQQAFAYYIAEAARANTDTHAQDRPEPTEAAVTLGQRIGVNMHEGWEGEAREQYLGKMAKADLAGTVLGLDGADAVKALKSSQADLVTQAVTAHWLPAYFDGLSGEFSAKYQRAEVLNIHAMAAE
jgi:ParB-like chromosome segregation protein Spo0J